MIWIMLATLAVVFAVGFGAEIPGQKRFAVSAIG